MHWLIGLLLPPLGFLSVTNVTCALHVCKCTHNQLCTTICAFFLNRFRRNNTQMAQRGKKHKWLHKPCLRWSPKESGIATLPLRSRGSPRKGNKIGSGYINSTFSGAQHGAEMLCYPCVLNGPRERGTKSKVATRQGETATLPMCSWGSPWKRGQKQKTLHTHCLLGGPEEGGSAMLSRRSRGFPARRTIVARVGPEEKGP